VQARNNVSAKVNIPDGIERDHWSVREFKAFFVFDLGNRRIRFVRVRSLRMEPEQAKHHSLVGSVPDAGQRKGAVQDNAYGGRLVQNAGVTSVFQKTQPNAHRPNRMR
jgi:hypothetical protein